MTKKATVWCRAFFAGCSATGQANTLIQFWIGQTSHKTIVTEHDMIRLEEMLNDALNHFGEWKPIETAPSGEKILVCGGAGIWSGPLIAFVHENYNGHKGVITEGHAGAVLSGSNRPSHWMELPHVP